MEELNKELRKAAGNGNEKEVISCLQKGADIHCTDWRDMTPLHWAAERGHDGVVTILLERGGDVNAKDEDRETPLHEAAGGGHDGVVKIVVDRGGDVNAKDNDDRTPLHTAARGGHDGVVKILLDGGGYVNAKDDKGQTPLHRAAWGGHDGVVKILLDGGGDLNAKDDIGSTPLHLSVKQSKENTAAFLIQAGCDLTITDNKNKSPLDYASDAFKVSLKNFTSSNLAAHHSTSQVSHVEDLNVPRMDDVNEFHDLMSRGTYASYSNLVFLGGACNVGKSTLASILIGGDIPKTWESTDTLEIFFGQFGIDLEKKEMVPLSEENTNILTTVLLGEPDIEESASSKDSKASTQVVAHDPPEEEKEITVRQKNMKKTKQPKDLRESSPILSPKPISEIKNVKNLTAKSYLTIRDEIKEEIKRGKYKVRIAPSDLIDFGGQRSFDMTHQLFIRQKGVFVIMIDGRKNLSDLLEEYPQGDVTTESIILHWVHSILTYCGLEDDDILPLIIFVATHSDSFPYINQLEERQCELTEHITELFEKHEYSERILFDTLFFINGTDKNDVGIHNLQAKLVEVAFKQKSWGQKVPMAWVPLDLQISEMRSKGDKLISMEELSNLNKANGELSLTEKQLEHYLTSQHLLGKIMYFNLPTLNRFIIIQPRALVDILKSFITDEMFWPKKDDELRQILEKVKSVGRITKQELFHLWQQENLRDCLPTDEIKEFISRVLLQLDVLIEPKRYKATEVSVEEYLVPCIVNRRVNQTILNEAIQDRRTICLSYRLKSSHIPSALSYKLMGALMNLWPVKETDEGFCLYHKAAILTIDGENELYVSITDNRIMIYLTNSKSCSDISPDIASIIRECVCFALEKILQFYHTTSGKRSTFDTTNLFEEEVGERCRGVDCLISLKDAQEQKEWKCQNDEIHKTKTSLIWMHDQKLKECSPGCEGRFKDRLDEEPEDKHLYRLAPKVSRGFVDLITNLGMPQNDWDDIQDHPDYPEPLTKRFLALCKCRDLGKTFQDFSKALQKSGHNDHLLCQVFLDKSKEVLEAATFKLQTIPDDDMLKALSKKIGNSAMPLGVELGLEFAQIQGIVYRNIRKMPDQNLDILKEWKRSCKNKTILFLMKALFHADSRGYNFLNKMFK